MKFLSEKTRWRLKGMVPFLGFGLIVSLVLFLLFLLVSANREEQRLIDSGFCEIRHTALYSPPPTMVCASYSPQGACTMMAPIQASPYFRDLWECENEQGEPREFWRRSE